MKTYSCLALEMARWFLGVFLRELVYTFIYVCTVKYVEDEVFLQRNLSHQ